METHKWKRGLRSNTKCNVGTICELLAFPGVLGHPQRSMNIAIYILSCRLIGSGKKTVTFAMHKELFFVPERHCTGLALVYRSAGFIDITGS